MMSSKQFIITLQEDAVISENSITTGGHISKTYIPGTVILGAVAKHLYSALKDDTSAWQIFHSGKVRFGNALPLSKGGYSGFPIPWSWFRDKSLYGIEEKRREHARNYTAQDLEYGQQVEQYRDGFTTLHVNNDAEIYQPDTKYSMKTAINPKVGIADDAQLFGNSSLSAGQLFSFSLDADADISKETLEQITDILLHKPIYIGRSRSAEYGTVNIEEIKEVPSDATPSLPEKEATNNITLWLQSDTLIYNEQGIPTLQPTAQNIGLSKDWELDLKHSFIHQRRVALFNARYQRRELERAVIGMGSVLYFKPKKGTTALTTVEDLQNLQRQGIGSYRQAGLGKIWINPPLLKTPQPQFSMVKPLVKIEKNIPVPPSDSPLLRYLNTRADHKDINETLISQAEKWKQELIKLYISAKNLAPYTQGVCVGPTPTQWGRVMDASKNTTSPEELYQQLFTNSNAICKKNDPQWDYEIIASDSRKKAKLKSFRHWFKTKLIKLENNEAEDNLIEITTRFARMAQDVARNTACKIEGEN